MSDEWIDLCAVDDIPEGAGLQIPLADRPPLAVFRVGEDIHVTDDTCTHGEASLCEGEVEDDIVVHSIRVPSTSPLVKWPGHLARSPFGSIHAKHGTAASMPVSR